MMAEFEAIGPKAAPAKVGNSKTCPFGHLNESCIPRTLQ